MSHGSRSPEQHPAEKPTAENFTVSVDEKVLNDLRSRIAATRLPDAPRGLGWSAGTEVGWLRDLLDRWADFDWRATERALNLLPMYRATLGTLRIHFIHQPGNGPRPLPLLLTHGWPSAFTEYSRLLPLLTDPGAHGADPADAFTVVVPSLPGFGFSDRPAAPGVAHPVIADLWACLMSQVLGYRRFAAHGSDIGAGVTARLARQHPDKVLGIHLSAASLPLPERPWSAAEQEYADAVARWDEQEGAYARVHATRPQTLGVALNDSPAGLASWIAEKYRAWTESGGDPESRLPPGYLPTLLTIYWATETAASSMRLYYEYREHVEPLRPRGSRSSQSVVVRALAATRPPPARRAPRACRPVSPCSDTNTPRCRSRRATWPSGTSTSRTGRSSRAAATSRRLRSPSRSPAICGTSSAHYARPSRPPELPELPDLLRPVAEA